MSAFFNPEKATWGQFKGNREAHQEITWGPSLVVQCLRCCTPSAGGLGSTWVRARSHAATESWYAAANYPRDAATKAQHSQINKLNNYKRLPGDTRLEKPALYTPWSYQQPHPWAIAINPRTKSSSSLIWYTQFWEAWVCSVLLPSK